MSLDYAYLTLYAIFVTVSNMYYRCKTLMEILSCYDVQLTPALKEMLDQYIVLPGESPSVATKILQQKLSSQIHCSLDSKYILSLKMSTTWKILKKLCHSLEEFLKPFSENLEFLVYFHLHKCEMFKDYLKCQLTEKSNAQSPQEESFPNKVLLSMPMKQSSVDFSERVTQVRTHTYVYR